MERRRDGFLNNLVTGAVGGGVGALAMTMIRSAGEEMGLIAEQLNQRFFDDAPTMLHTDQPGAFQRNITLPPQAAHSLRRPADAFDWTAHMLVGPGLHGQM